MMLRCLLLPNKERLESTIEYIYWKTDYFFSALSHCETSPDTVMYYRSNEKKTDITKEHIHAISAIKKISFILFLKNDDHFFLCSKYSTSSENKSKIPNARLNIFFDIIFIKSHELKSLSFPRNKI